MGFEGGTRRLQWVMSVVALIEPEQLQRIRATDLAPLGFAQRRVVEPCGGVADVLERVVDQSAADLKLLQRLLQTRSGASNRKRHHQAGSVSPQLMSLRSESDPIAARQSNDAMCLERP